MSLFIYFHVADELDSYMYQTVGHQAIDLYADAMDLPLYRRTIQGSSLDTSKNYSKTDGDEVEDLYELLHLVKVGTICTLCFTQSQKFNVASLFFYTMLLLHMHHTKRDWILFRIELQYTTTM